jgi:hypothetical protein
MADIRLITWQEVMEIVKGIDTDGNGTIDIDEWENGIVLAKYKVYLQLAMANNYLDCARFTLLLPLLVLVLFPIPLFSTLCPCSLAVFFPLRIQPLHRMQCLASSLPTYCRMHLKVLLFSLGFGCFCPPQEGVPCGWRSRQKERYIRNAASRRQAHPRDQAPPRHKLTCPCASLAPVITN